MMIDFRSDTVTLPSDEMKDFMFNAPLGDDVFEEDPTINELERFSAEMFGMEAALFCASGTQTNQIAINVHCKPGDEVICSKEAHIYKYEGGGIAKNAGSSVKLLEGNRGRVAPNDVLKAINDPDNVHYPLTSLVALEDTMNRGGGAIYNYEDIALIKKICDDNKLPLHLDGARLFNSLVETGIDYKKYAANFDSISICLSKGLGAPVGSVLLGSKDFISKSRRIRKVMGGGMRQAGIIAAGGLFALQNNIERLKEDHENARMLGDCFEGLNWIESVVPVDTNIVVANLNSQKTVEEVINKLEQNDILAMPFGDQMIRLVTHLDISKNDIDRAISVIKSI